MIEDEREQAGLDRHEHDGGQQGGPEAQTVEAHANGAGPVTSEHDQAEAQATEGDPGGDVSGGDEWAEGDSGGHESVEGDSGGDDSGEGGDRPLRRRRSADTAFEEFAAAWVPPWARALPELLIEPAADYTPEELALGRLAYADPDELPNPDDFEPGLGDGQLRGALEAILLVIDEPVATSLLAQVLEEPPIRIEATLQTLAGEYFAAGRGFELRQVAGGWRLYTRTEFAGYVERFVLDGQQIRLTQAALETLAVVAYKQPVTRSRVSAIRGVNCDGVMKTLVTRGLVEECGTESDSGAHLYQTTRLFLEKVGINSVADLPSLGPLLPNNVNEIDIAQR